MARGAVKIELQKIAAEKNVKITTYPGEVTAPEVPDILGIMIEARESTIGGHTGVGRIYNRIRERYF